MFGHSGKDRKTVPRRLIIGAVAAVAVSAVALAVADPAQAMSAGRVRAIPAAAMLQPADLGGVQVSPADVDLRPWLRPPQPCGSFRSAAKRGADRAVQAVYPVGPVTPTVLLEYVAVYRGSGAAQYLRELQRAVGHCHGCVAAGRTWRIIGRGVAGRQSLLRSVRETVGYEGSNRVQTTYLAVALTGHAIVVLADIGWEIGDGHVALVRALAPRAVARAAILR